MKRKKKEKGQIKKREIKREIGKKRETQRERRSRIDYLFPSHLCCLQLSLPTGRAAPVRVGTYIQDARGARKTVFVTVK